MFAEVFLYQVFDCWHLQGLGRMQQQQLISLYQVCMWCDGGDELTCGEGLVSLHV
jgi:hypothetical protein